MSKSSTKSLRLTRIMNLVVNKKFVKRREKLGLLTVARIEVLK